MGDAKRTVAALKQIGTHIPHPGRKRGDSAVEDANGIDPNTTAAGKQEVDLETYPTAARLVKRCRDFFAEVEDLYVHSH